MRPRPCPAFILFLLSVLTAPVAVRAADLEIAVQGLRNDHGRLRIGLYRSAEGWPEQEPRFAALILPATAGAMVLKGLPPGRYAVAAFHDENGNGRLDRTLLGLPSEGYALSRGQGSFDAAAFDLTEPGRSVPLTLDY